MDEEGRSAKKAMVAGLEVNQEDEALPALAESEYDEDEYYDDKTGRVLEPRLVEEADTEEIDYMMKLEVGQEVDEQECWTMTGKGPVTTIFVRVNKGTVENPDVRARLCARDFKPKGG